VVRYSQRALIIVGIFGLLVGAVLGQSGLASLVFPDVPDTEYYSNAVANLARMGIVTGYESGNFGPNDTLTRGQIATILVRYDEKMIKPLREQIAELRDKNNMGRCGDQTVQTGEECDDGNTVDGDGCSALCLTEETLKEYGCGGDLIVGESFPAGDGCNTCVCQEDQTIFCTRLVCEQDVTCSDGHKAGETYLAEDGCNQCTCGSDGEVTCTELSCEDVDTCVTSEECPPPQVCSTIYGDCFTSCAEGEVCIQVCGGICTEIRQEPPTTCGNNICDPGEEASQRETVCEEGDEECTPTMVDVPGTCPEDCAAINAACEDKKVALDALFDENRECQTDADCDVYLRACSPYLTCGKPIDRRKTDLLKSAVLKYVSECQGDEPIACALCQFSQAVCVEGLCELDTEGTPQI